MGFFSPKWVSMIPEGLRPPGKSINNLETIRQRYDCSHSDFALLVLASPATTKAQLEQTAKTLRSKYSQASPKQILAGTFESRLLGNDFAFDMQRLRVLNSPSATIAQLAYWNTKIELAMKRIADIQKGIEPVSMAEWYSNTFEQAVVRSNSLDDLVRYFMKREKSESSADPSDITYQIAAALGWFG